MIPTESFLKFPFPIEVVCEIYNSFRLQNEVIGAWLQTRDIYEVITKFCASLLLSELNHFNPNCANKYYSFVRMKPLSFGDWVELYASLVEDEKENSPKRFFANELSSKLFSVSKRSKPVPGRVLRILREAVSWRNNEIGHGALGRKIERIIEDVEKHEKIICELLQHHSILTQSELFIESSSFNKNRLLITAELMLDISRIHELSHSELKITSMEDVSFSLNPLIVLNMSKNKEDKDVNGIIVFDKLIQRSTNLQNRIMYLDFETGRKVILLNNSISNWGEKERNLTQSYQDAKNLFKLIRSDLLGYNIEFQKRIDSLRFGWDNPMMIIGRTCKIEKLVNWIENGVSGYIHCLGSSGCGKSWFAKSLLDYRHMGSLSNSILMYHLGFGANSSQAVFISSLTEQVRTRFGLHQAILAEEFSSEAAQKRMIQFLECVKTNSDQEELILVIDGYDEVMTTSRNSITPLDFLPDEEMLPEGVFIILLGRPFDECGSIAKSAIRRLSDSLNKRMISFDEEPNEARLLVSTLVERELINQSDIIKTKVIELSEESPLRAAHFCALINTGVAQVIFSNNTSISNLYKSFLSGIEKKVGSIYFNSLYRPLLSILAVARAPLPLSFLADVIGVIQEKALIAVIDLSHLIRSVRDDGLGEVKLEIYHREYREYVRDVEADWVLGHNLLASFLTQIGSISSGNSEEYVDLYSSKNLIIHLIGAGKRAELIEYFKNTFSSGILIDPEQLISGLRPCETVASVQICLERLYLLREIFLELELQRDYKNTILVVIDANISGHLGSKNPKEASEILSSAISILESSDFLKKDYRLRSSLNYKLFEAYINLGLRDNAKIALERSIRIYETELRETQKADERALSLIQLVWYYIGMANCFSDEKNSKTQYMLMANNFLTLICDLKDLDDDVKNQKWRVEGYLYFNSAFVFPAEQQSFLERSIDAYKMAQIADPEDSQLLYSLISSMRALANFFYDHNSFYLARKILFEAQNLLDKLVRYDSSNLFYIRMKAILNRIKAQLDIQENDLASAISLMEIACSEMGKVKTSIINNAIKREYDLYLSELEEMKGRLN